MYNHVTFCPIGTVFPSCYIENNNNNHTSLRDIETISLNWFLMKSHTQIGQNNKLYESFLKQKLHLYYTNTSSNPFSLFLQWASLNLKKIFFFVWKKSNKKEPFSLNKFPMKYFLSRLKIFDIVWIGLSFVSFCLLRFHWKNAIGCTFFFNSCSLLWLHPLRNRHL